MAVTAAYLQRGEALDYWNTTEETIPHGVIIPIGTRIGVTGCEIPPGRLGSLHVCGVFRVRKTDTAAIAMGQTVYFDGTGITGQASSSGGAEKSEASAADTVIEVGYAAAPAGEDDETVLVKLNG